MFGFNKVSMTEIILDTSNCFLCENYFRRKSLIMKKNNKLYNISNNEQVPTEIYTNMIYWTCYSCAGLLEMKSFDYENKTLKLKNIKLNESYWSKLSIKMLKKVLNTFFRDLSFDDQRKKLYKVHNKILNKKLPVDLIEYIYMFTLTEYMGHCLYRIKKND